MTFNEPAIALHNLKFAVEVSTRYHDWRRSFLERWLISVRIISTIGAMLALIGLFVTDTTTFFGLHVPGPYLIGVGSAAIAIISIVDLALRADAAAIQHADLYRRFKELQAEIAAKPRDSMDQIAHWESAAQEIRSDEPPTLWALYMIAWNQAVERQDPRERRGARKVNGFQSLTRNLFHFLPKDFPLLNAQERAN